jgi:hypothetical protein
LQLTLLFVVPCTSSDPSAGVHGDERAGQVRGQP